MKRFLILILALLMLTACGQEAGGPEQTGTEAAASEETDAQTEEETMALAPFSAQTLTGETVTEACFADAELTVINVWATYCGPCKQEMPILGQLDRELDNVQVLGIVTDVVDQNAEPDAAQVELAQELLAAAECEYPNLILNQSLANLGFASLSAVPATLFVDSEGYLVGQGFYGALDEESWRSVIAERLELTAP